MPFVADCTTYLPMNGRVQSFYIAEALLLLFSVVDSAFTHLWLSTGVATEANPLLAAAWSLSPMTFHGVKALLILASALILHRLRELPVAQTTMATAALTYSAVVSWHLVHL